MRYLKRILLLGIGWFFFAGQSVIAQCADCETNLCPIACLQILDLVRVIPASEQEEIKLTSLSAKRNHHGIYTRSVRCGDCKGLERDHSCGDRCRMAPLPNFRKVKTIS